MPKTVLLGNTSPQHQIRVPKPDATPESIADGTGVRQIGIPHPYLKDQVTVVRLWDGVDDPELVKHTLSTPNDRDLVNRSKALGTDHAHYAVALHEIESLLPAHTGGTAPAWVSCPEDRTLEAALADYYGCPQLSDPEDQAQVKAAFAAARLGPGPTMLLTNGGRDVLHHAYMDTATQPAACNYGALSANTTAPAATDTTLTGEIATAGGGLIRAQMTFAHTTGTNTSTLTHTWTANSSDTLPVTIAKWASFNASSSGTMGDEDLLSSTATLNVSGDSLTVTFTLTAG